MTTSAVPPRDELSRYVRSLFEINVSDEGASAEQSDECKAVAKLIYSRAVACAAEGFPWNWGYQSEEMHRELKSRLPNYSPVVTDGYSEQLYLYVAHELGMPDLSGKKVLDVGCGAGQGLNFVSRAYKAQEFVGLDLCPEAIERAQSSYERPGLRFVCGDSEAMPFEDGEFDAVINVESSHNYPNLGRFFDEVSRVLKPGGVFSCADLFTEQRYEHWRRCKPRSSLRWLAETDIGEPVRRAIHARLEPGSIARRQIRAVSMRPLPRFLAEPLTFSRLGAGFAGHRFSALERFGKTLFRAVASSETPYFSFSRYLHNLAVKD